MTDHQEAESLVERLRANAQLQAAWYTFELGMPAPPPLHHRDTFDLLIEASDRLTLLEKAGGGTGAAQSQPCAETGTHIPSSPLAQRLLDRVLSTEGPDRRLDGELDALVGHVNEAWPPAYTREVMYLQQITPKLGLDTGDISKVALELMDGRPWRSVALLYAEALLTALTTSTHPRIEGEGSSISSSGGTRACTMPPAKTDSAEGH